MAAGIANSPKLVPAAEFPTWPYWRQDAACRDGDPDAFFPPDGRNTKARARADAAACRVCAGCPVQLPCLATALLQREEHGVWGGLTSGKRAALPRPVTAEEALGVAARAIGEDERVCG